MTRVRVIQMWFVAVALVFAAAVALGVPLQAGTSGMLVGLSIVPAVIIFLLWPQAQPLSAGDVLHGTDRSK